AFPPPASPPLSPLSLHDALPIYLPLIATMTFDTEPLQHIVAALLRPGTGAPTRGVRGLLRRLFTKLHALFPRVKLGEQPAQQPRSEEHTSELQSRGHLVCRLLLE